MRVILGMQDGHDRIYNVSGLDYRCVPQLEWEIAFALKREGFWISYDGGEDF